MGLMLGREGPSIQLGAMTAKGLAKGLKLSARAVSYTHLDVYKRQLLDIKTIQDLLPFSKDYNLLIVGLIAVTLSLIHILDLKVLFKLAL